MARRPIVLDLDATDDPVHGDQEGKFFHGYYDHYCFLPLFIVCGDAHGRSRCAGGPVTADPADVADTRILCAVTATSARTVTWCEGPYVCGYENPRLNAMPRDLNKPSGFPAVSGSTQDASSCP